MFAHGDQCHTFRRRGFRKLVHFEARVQSMCVMAVHVETPVAQADRRASEMQKREGSHSSFTKKTIRSYNTGRDYIGQEVVREYREQGQAKVERGEAGAGGDGLQERN